MSKLKPTNTAKSKDNVICYVASDCDNMSKNECFGTGRSVICMASELNGLNDIYRELADEIGIENTIVIYKLFHGTQISFPNRLFSRQYTHKAIVNEYNGKNVPQLALKYNYSERSIWRIIKSNK